MARSPLVERLFPANHQAHFSDLQVLQSGDGWYIGTVYTDPTHGFTEPGSRARLGVFRKREHGRDRARDRPLDPATERLSVVVPPPR